MPGRRVPAAAGALAGVLLPARRAAWAMARRALLGALAGAALTLAALVAWLASRGGGAFAVVSDSMAPTMRAGDLVLVERVDPRAVRPGDVVAFPAPDASRTIVHRALRVTPARDRIAFVTRGDANSVSERWSVPSGGSLGRVRWVVPRVGAVTHFAASPAGWLLLIATPAGLLALMEVHRLRRRGRT